MARVWMVTIPIEVPVIAVDEKEAQTIAFQHVERAARWLSPFTKATAREITGATLLHEDANCIPWNAPADESIAELLGCDE